MSSILNVMNGGRRFQVPKKPSPVDQAQHIHRQLQSVLEGTPPPEEEVPQEEELPEAWQPPEFPDDLGACIDLAYNLRKERLAAEKTVAEMKAAEENIRNHLFATFGEEGLEGAKGSIATASVSEELKPQVDDWDQVYAYIVEKEAWDLLEKRMSRVAFRDRFEAGEYVPGTQAFNHKKLSLVKSNRK